MTTTGTEPCPPSPPAVRTVAEYGTFENILAASGPRACDLAHRLRALVADVQPGVVEVE